MNNICETGAFEDIVRMRAYAIWESEGRPNGRDIEHWFISLEETRRFAEAKMAEAPVKATKSKAKKAIKAPAASRRASNAVRVSPSH